MKNQLLKEYKWILSVIIAVIVIIICTACIKEDDEQKTMASLIEDQLDDLAEETVSTDGESAEDDAETIGADEKNIVNDIEIIETDRKSVEDTAETVKIDEESMDDKWDVDFEVVTDSYTFNEQQNGIEIYYPQLCGFEDSVKEERINTLLEEDVMQIVGEKNTEGEDSFYRIYLKYKIMFLNNRVISILYKGGKGYITTGHSAVSSIAIATAIDIEEEKEITLQDIVTDFTGLSDMLLADEFEGITVWEGVKGEYPFSGEFSGTVYELEENLREKPQEWYTDGENFIFINMKGRYYNEYSISFESVACILDAEFLKKLE